MRHKPKEIRLVHGDKEAKAALKDKLESTFKSTKITV